jgi:hypothetical protein
MENSDSRRLLGELAKQGEDANTTQAAEILGRSLGDGELERQSAADRKWTSAFGRSGRAGP